MIVVAGISFYALLGISSTLIAVAGALALIGWGIGFLTPANQKLAFAAVGPQDYGVLSAMISSFGTAAGTIGITITMALMEAWGGARLWTEPAVLVGAQRFAFLCMLPLGIIAVMIGVRTGRGAQRRNQSRTGLV